MNTANRFGFRLDRLNISAFHYRMLALIAAGMFFDSFDIYIAGGVLGAMVQSGESTLPLNAAFLSATFVGMMLGAWLSGVMGDRFGRKFCYQFNLLIYGGASVAGALAPSMTWLIGLRFIMGLGMGAEIVVGYGTLSEFIPARHRGRFGTILNLIINTTLFIATFLGWLIIPSYGWRWMFVIAGVGALAVWFVRQSMPESPRWLATKGRDREADAIVRMAETQSTVDESWKDDSAAADHAQKGGRLADLFAPRLRMRTITGIVVLVALFIVNYAFVSWVPTFLVKQGHTISNSLGLTALMFAGGPLGSFIGFLLSERIGRKWGIVVFSLLGLVSGVFCVFATSTVALSIAGFAITCIIYVLSSLSIAVYVPELFPTNVRLRGVGLCNATGRAVSIVVPYVVAYTFDRSGISGVIALISATLLAQAVIVAAIGAETRQRSLENLVPQDDDLPTAIPNTP